MRLQLDPGDDEAETQLIRALADDVAPRVRNALRQWLRKIFGPGMSDAEILDWERRLRDQEVLLRDVIERAVVDATDLGVTVAIDQLGQVGIGFDWTLVNTRARENARQYAGQLITQITDTTRNTVREAVARYINNGEPLSALISDLQSTGFSERRAKLIAATEVTGAFARANEAAYRESGVVETMEWRTATDEKVCPVCGKLDGQRVPMGQRFEGVYMPPAHPGCRCWIAPIVKSPQEIAELAAAAIADNAPG